jgi:hypothetical protein
MIEFALGLAGSTTIVALVVLGILVYPWLLQKRYGPWVIAACTGLLALLFFYFDHSRGTPLVISAAFGTLWAVAPVIAALIARRLRGPSS